MDVVTLSHYFYSSLTELQLLSLRELVKTPIRLEEILSPSDSGFKYSWTNNEVPSSLSKKLIIIRERPFQQRLPSSGVLAEKSLPAFLRHSHPPSKGTLQGARPHWPSETGIFLLLLSLYLIHYIYTVQAKLDTPIKDILLDGG